jgi:hypothetical protein
MEHNQMRQLSAFVLAALQLAFVAVADDARISIHADKTLFTLSDMMIGANMEDLHYQMVGGFDSQLIHGESFFEPSPTQFAAKNRIAGFDNCGGSGALDNGELVLGKGTRLTAKTDTVEGIAAFAGWLKTRAPQASVGILEFNAGAFDFQRGLSHALEMNAAYRHGDVIRAVGTPNVSPPWGIYQTDWKAVLWTQGNIYYTPSKVWFQPAYYVDQMIAASWAPEAVAVEAPATLDAFAAKTADGAKLVLRVVNNTGNAQSVNLDWQGSTRDGVSIRVTTLAHADPLDYNTESQPEKIKPVVKEETSPKHIFPPYSFTVMEMPIKP